MIFSTHVLVGGTNDGRRLSFQGVQAVVPVLAELEAWASPVSADTSAPIEFETYRLECVATMGGRQAVICLHESLNVHDGLVRLLEGYNPKGDA